MSLKRAGYGSGLASLRVRVTPMKHRILVLMVFNFVFCLSDSTLNLAWIIHDFASEKRKGALKD